MKKTSPEMLELADQLHSAAIHLLRQLRTEDRVSGIGPAQLSALSVLVFGGKMFLRQLAAIEQVASPTMVRIVQALVEQKLVVSRPDKEDARKISIAATARGRKLMLRARNRRVQALAKMLSQRPPAELNEFRRAAALMKNMLHRGES